MSLVIFLTSVVTLLGKPSRVDLGLAGEVGVLGDLDRHVGFLALLDAGRREGQAEIWWAMVRLASCDETMIGPLATPEAPLTTIFQVRSSAPAVGVHGD